MMATVAMNPRMRRERLRGALKEAYKPRPTAWERFLARHSLTHDDAIQSLIRGCGGHAHKLRAWLKANYFRSYVPEDVLEAAQLDRQANWHW